MNRLEKERRAMLLGWRILEFKCVYYFSINIHPDWEFLRVPDAVYDNLEKEYEQLCHELNQEPTASNMVGFSSERASCKIVEEKLSKPMHENYMGSKDAVQV